MRSPVLAPSLRPLPRCWLAASSGTLLLGFVALAALVHQEPGPQAFDAPGIRLVTSSAVAEAMGLIPGSRSLTVFTELATLGSVLPGLSMVVAMATVASVRGDRPSLILCVLGPATAVFVAVIVAKPLVDRVREGALMFPSGHTTAAAAIAVVALVLLFRLCGRRGLLRFGWVPLLLPLAVSLGVVRMNWHYPTDALGGVMLGAGVVFAVAAALPARWPPDPEIPDHAAEMAAPENPSQR